MQEGRKEESCSPVANGEGLALFEDEVILHFLKHL